MICNSGRSTELSLHFKYRERLHYECRPGKAGKTRQLTKMGRPVRRKSLGEHPGDALKGRSVVADGSIFHEAPSRKFHGRVTGTRGRLPACAGTLRSRRANICFALGGKSKLVHAQGGQKPGRTVCTSCLTATTQSTGAPGAPPSHGPAAGSRAAMSALQTLGRAAPQVSHRPGEDVAGRGRPAGAARLGWGKGAACSCACACRRAPARGPQQQRQGARAGACASGGPCVRTWRLPACRVPGREGRGCGRWCGNARGRGDARFGRCQGCVRAGPAHRPLFAGLGSRVRRGLAGAALSCVARLLTSLVGDSACL